MAEPLSPAAAAPPSAAGAEARLAARAGELMAQNQVPPTPANYAVWYYYAEGKNPGLKREIEALLNKKVGFSPQTNAYLYNTYVTSAGQSPAAAAAVDAQQILGQVLSLVKEFGSDTASYTTALDGQVQQMTQRFAGTPLAGMVDELAGGITQLRERSNTMQQKLETSSREVETLRKNLSEVTHEAQKDFLTGVANRKALEQTLNERMEVALQEKSPLCLIMLDIDHFKQFNDKFGHLLGDEVLKIVARALTDSVKGKDLVARYGGEEFTIVLPDTPLNGAMAVAESIRRSIASKDLKRKDTHQSYGTITVSAGVALFRPDSDTLPLLFKRADEALYRSKAAGRNRVSVESAEG